MPRKSILKTPGSAKKPFRVRFADNQAENTSPSRRSSDVITAIQSAKNRIISHLSEKSSNSSPINRRFSSPPASFAAKNFIKSLAYFSDRKILASHAIRLDPSSFSPLPLRPVSFTPPSTLFRLFSPSRAHIKTH